MTRVDKGDQEVGKARMRMSDPILARENEIETTATESEHGTKRAQDGSNERMDHSSFVGTFQLVAHYIYKSIANS